MRQVPRDGGGSSEERIRHTVKGQPATGRRYSSHLAGQVFTAQFQRKSVLMMHEHHQRRVPLILNDANPGEMHLQFVHTA
ncbi:hypothetical protein [Roseibium alexandrii]|uniref:Uncharacterized protein n=1 Tax=Roseibium alexandrii TaxID=388408 RepID=A0A0M7AM95_9HYPH|nr:hypothetical protein [Roseibium alexandrii]CTQ75562.1 hypothetical protein LAX5112_04284 [Roseibium alexandrii]